MAARKVNIVAELNKVIHTYRWVALAVGLGTGLSAFVFLASFERMPIAGAVFISLYIGFGSAVLAIGVCNRVAQRVRSLRNLSQTITKVTSEIWNNRKPPV